jgi:hypothetical protein
MANEHVFIPDFEKSICKTYTGAFIKITDERITALATSSGIIAGRQTQAAMVFLFTESWAKKYFFDAIHEPAGEIQRRESENQRIEQATARRKSEREAEQAKDNRDFRGKVNLPG